jgi:hypothetical protein
VKEVPMMGFCARRGRKAMRVKEKERIRFMLLVVFTNITNKMETPWKNSQGVSGYLIGWYICLG